MTFVRLIECRTRRFEETNRLLDTWAERARGRRTATHVVVGKDRSDGAHIVELVEFPSSEEATRNLNLPETDEVFRRLTALCDETPTFTDLDVVRDEQPYDTAVRRFYDALTAAGELSPLNDLIDEDCHSHDPVNPQVTIGLDAVRRDFRMWRDAFDAAFTIEDLIPHGDRVCIRWTWTATHKGEFLGITPTGKQVTMTGMTLFHFGDNGKITEIWWQHDQLGLLQQLGALEGLES